MSKEQFSQFKFSGKSEDLKFVEQTTVTVGVECSVYEFVEDREKDLAIVTVAPGAKTPCQKVLLGDRTIEGYIAGRGTLTIITSSGTKAVHTVDQSTSNFVVEVQVGEIMQWQAATDCELMFYEVCFPPYKEGRFEVLERIAEKQK